MLQRDLTHDPRSRSNHISFKLLKNLFEKKKNIISKMKRKINEDGITNLKKTAE